MKKFFLFRAFPVISSCFFVLLINTIAPPQGYSYLCPSVAIVCVIFWSMRKDHFFSSIDVFIFGFLNDLIFGTPLGSSSILFLSTMYFTIFLNNRIKFYINFLNLTVIVASNFFYFILTYIFIIVYYQSYPIMSYYILYFLLTLFIYPIIYIILNKIINYKKLNEL